MQTTAVSTASAARADALTSWNVELLWVCGLDYVVDQQYQLDLVAFAEPCLWRRRMIDVLGQSGRHHRITFSSQSIAALQSAIENGLGVGLLPPEAIRTDTMRVLKATAGVPAPLIVQYGLYARDRRTPVVKAAVGALLESVPASARPLHQMGSQAEP